MLFFNARDSPTPSAENAPTRTVVSTPMLESAMMNAISLMLLEAMDPMKVYTPLSWAFRAILSITFRVAGPSRKPISRMMRKMPILTSRVIQFMR